MDTTTNKNLTRRGDTTAERVQERPLAAPLVDVYENKDELVILADVPGATKDTVSVHIDEDQLTLEARRSFEAPGTLLAGESRPHDYQRAFVVPEGIDASKIEAHLAGGVLRVRLPKSEAHKPRHIAVKAS